MEKEHAVTLFRGVGLICGVMCGATAVFLFPIHAYFISPVPYTTLKKALENASVTEDYRHHVETTTTISDRRLRVEGLYDVHHSHNRYRALSTTTLTIPPPAPEQGAHTFTLESITINDDAYIALSTDSELLQKNIPLTNGWRHFTQQTLTTPFDTFVTIGPILDNLLLFKNDGAYLDRVGRVQVREEEGQRLALYTFALSPLAYEQKRGTLPSLVGRIGTSTLSVWITHDDSPRLYRMSFSHNGYHSTTTFFLRQTPVPIEAPLEAR